METRLKDIYLFSALSEKEMHTLLSISSLHTYHDGELLFMQGERSEHLLVLSEGEVTVYKHDDKGNEIIIAFFSANAMVAEPAILAHHPFPSSSRFKGEGSVIKIELQAFEDELLSNAHVSRQVIHSLLEKVDLLQNNIQRNLASSAKDKILQLYSENESLVSKLKNYELATLLGMSAETFSRAIKQLVLEKRLEKTEKSYTVLS